MRVECLAQEHNTMSLARTQTPTARSGVEFTNHDANMPPTRYNVQVSKKKKLSWRHLFVECETKKKHFVSLNNETLLHSNGSTPKIPSNMA